MIKHNFTHIGFSYLQENFGNETEIFIEIIQEAQRNIPEVIQQLETDLSNKNWKSLGETAHQLKGVVQIFDMKALAQVLKKLQLDTERNQNQQQYPQTVAETVKTCTAVIAELQIAIQLL